MDTKFLEDLDRLASFLKERPRTGRDITETLRCSKPTSYHRLRQLEWVVEIANRGACPRLCSPGKCACAWAGGGEIARGARRDGRTGPLAETFHLVPKKPAAPRSTTTEA